MEAELIPEDEPLILPPNYGAFISYSHREVSRLEPPDRINLSLVTSSNGWR